MARVCNREKRAKCGLVAFVLDILTQKALVVIVDAKKK